MAAGIRAGSRRLTDARWMLIGVGLDTPLLLPLGMPHQIVNSGDALLETLGLFAIAPVPTHLPNGQALALSRRTGAIVRRGQGQPAVCPAGRGARWLASHCGVAGHRSLGGAQA